tara:strand:+ start:1513 stop:2151 length:639 start_codon:yes stop_codon:yes gene_type:complete
MSQIKLLHSGGNGVIVAAPASNPASDITFKLPQADGSANEVLKTDGSGQLAFAGISAGITEYDAWYLTANKTSTGVLDANLIRNNRNANAAPLGTGMSESSGVFTFPSTGKYLVIVQATYELVGGDNVSVHTEVTTDNSNYVDIAHAFDGNGGSNNRLGGNASFSFIDVTDTSNVKVRFYADSINSGSAVRGIDSSSTFVQTAFHFIRIADT